MTGAPAAKPTALPLPLQFLAAWIGYWVARRQESTIEYLKAENRALHERLGKRQLRLTVVERRRLAVLAQKLGRKVLGEVASIASPDTLLRWYRELVARKYDGSDVRGPGRPRKPGEIVELVVKMAEENPTWGYTRIKGALWNLGLKVGRTTIQRILEDRGIEPAPERGKRMSWKTFIKVHLGAITAADFFTVETVSMFGMIRYYVFFVIDIGSRKVEVAGITHSPCGQWMEQVARNLLDAESGFLRGKTCIILDRDPLYTKAFRGALEGAGVKVKRIPPRSPDLNAFAERFVQTIKNECLDRIVPLGEEHLRQVVREYMVHYHGERNHQGLGNALIEPMMPANLNGQVRRRERLGGLLNFYHRVAA